MSTITAQDIDPAEIQAEIRRIAAENPDHVYLPDVAGECVYTEMDTDDHRVGSCIVGKALINLGVDPVRLSWSEGKFAASVLGEPGAAADSIIGWINTVQQYQDDKISWGRAVAKADGVEA